MIAPAGPSADQKVAPVGWLFDAFFLKFTPIPNAGRE